MDSLFNQMMQRQGGVPPSPAVGQWTGYKPPMPDREGGWSLPQKPQQPPQAPPQQPPAQPPVPPPTPPAAPAAPMAPQGMPPPPPNAPSGVPPQAKRFANAQMMQDAYRNGWQPNPILLKALLSRGGA